VTEFTRRRFLQISTAAGVTALLPIRITPGAWAAPLPGGSLDPLSVPKYVAPLVIPPQMPRTKRGRVDYYEIAVRQFDQQILPADFPPTTVWSYGSVNHPGSFNYPAFTIEARYRRPVRVKWINGLVDDDGGFLPHLLPVDPTLHWANPPGGDSGRDSRPTFGATPGPYTGPVPIVTHLHGGHSADHSDGYTEAWYLPAARDIPAGFATEGSRYDYFQSRSPLGESWGPGNAVFEYENDQRATTMWYHDHTLGITRLNVYAGPAGFYLLRRGPGDLPAPPLPGPAPRLGDPPGTRYYEIPIAIQDRAFNTDGSLFYPDTRAFFDGFTGRTSPAATCRRSGIPRSSRTRWSSTAGVGRCWTSSRGDTASACSTAATRGS
jgi:spore coat protein A, manganese oxidase